MDLNKILRANNIETSRIASIDEVVREPKVLVPIKELSRNLVEDVFETLIHPNIRRGASSTRHDVIIDNKKKISGFIEKDQPIKFVFQGFPFKCRNPIETLRRTPDLGELAFLQRLADINKTVAQLYPPGVEFTVLTEGQTYKDLFGANGEEVVNFEGRCRYFLRKLGADRVVTFVDFLDTVDDTKHFLDMNRTEEERLYKKQTYTSQENIDQLVPVMMRSLPITQEVSYEDLLTVFGFGVEFKNLSNFQMDFLEYLSEAAKELSIKYLAIQNTKSSLNTISSKYPEHIYISTTSKTERYSFHPIHRRTRLYPHHGVPVYGSDKVDIVFLGEVISSPRYFKAVYCDDDIEDAPFYFLKGRQHLRK